MDFADMNFRLIAPELLLFLWSLIILFIDMGNRDKNPRRTGLLSLLGLIAVLYFTLTTPSGTLFGDTFIVDSYAIAFKTVFILCSALPA